MSTNLLLAISAVAVGAILLSVNHAAISDFYAYSVPYNDFVVAHMAYSSDPDSFHQTKQQGSACFVTPSNNEYCYGRPHSMGDISIAYIVGSNGIDGEMHLEPVGRATGYWAIGKMVPVSETTGVITFSDSISLYRDEALHRSDTPEGFEFTRTVERYDTFVANCRNDGRVVDIVQYLGVVTVEGTKYVATWHVHAESERGIPCDYPEIIRHSFGHDFGV